MKEYEPGNYEIKPATEIVFENLATGIEAVSALMPSRSALKEIVVFEVVRPLMRRILWS